MDKRNHFNALLSYYTAGTRLPDELRLQYWDALLQYGFTQSLPENLDPLVMAVMDGMIPSINISFKRAASGKQGGSKSPAPAKQNGSKMEASVKQNGSKHEGEKGERRKEEGERRKKEEEKKPTKKEAAPPSLDEFEQFWQGCQVIPGSKKEARKKWDRMRKEKRTDLSWQELMEKFNKLVDIEKQKHDGNTQYVPHISTWINQDRWEQELVEPPKKFPFNLPTTLYLDNEIPPHAPHLVGKELYYEDKYDGRVFEPDGTLCTAFEWNKGLAQIW